MSMRQVLATLFAALNDNVTGIAARAAVVAAGDGLANVRTDYVIGPWVLSGELHPATYPRISIGPATGATTLMVPPETKRDGEWTFDISFETFDADPINIQDNTATTATALLQVLDTLREYSDAHAGTVAQVREPISFRFGNFGGISSANGFVCTATISERGST
jgi:hypothetical protein